MKVHIQQSENGLALCLPHDLAERANLQPDTDVDVSIEGGRLVIASNRRRYTVEELLQGLGDQEPHPEWDTGPSVGQEIIP